MTRRSYSGNAASTTLAAAVGAGDMTLRLADPSGYPTGMTGPFFVSINRDVGVEEKVLCSGRTGDTLTVASRGADGTSPQSHSKGAPVAHVWTATDADEANAHVNSTTDVHGVEGNLRTVIGTTAEDAANAAVVMHEAQDDPHAQYQKETEKAQAGGYASLDGTGKVPAAQLPATDHGALTGLADDDHPQYLTQARADALFLTPTEGDALFLTQAEADAAYVMPYAIFTINGGVTIPSGVPTPMQLGLLEQVGGFALAGNKVVAPVRGLYVLTAVEAHTGGPGSGQRSFISIRGGDAAGGTVFARSAIGPGETIASTSGAAKLNAGDAFTFVDVYQSSGGSWVTDAGEPSSRFHIVLLRRI